MFSFAALQGAPCAAQLLLDCTAAPLRTAGLKALFELGRSFPGALAAPGCAVEVASAVESLAAQASARAAQSGGCAEPEDEEVLRHAEMLRGLLRSMSAQ